MDSDEFVRKSVFLVVLQLIKFLPVLYINFSRHRIWREGGSWYRNLKQPPI